LGGGVFRQIWQTEIFSFLSLTRLAPRHSSTRQGREREIERTCSCRRITQTHAPSPPSAHKCALRPVVACLRRCSSGPRRRSSPPHPPLAAAYWRPRRRPPVLGPPRCGAWLAVTPCPTGWRAAAAAAAPAFTAPSCGRPPAVCPPPSSRRLPRRRRQPRCVAWRPPRPPLPLWTPRPRMPTPRPGGPWPRRAANRRTSSRQRPPSTCPPRTSRTACCASGTACVKWGGEARDACARAFLCA